MRVCVINATCRERPIVAVVVVVVAFIFNTQWIISNQPAACSLTRFVARSVLPFVFVAVLRCCCSVNSVVISWRFRQQQQQQLAEAAMEAALSAKRNAFIIAAFFVAFRCCCCLTLTLVLVLLARFGLLRLPFVSNGGFGNQLLLLCCCCCFGCWNRMRMSHGLTCSSCCCCCCCQFVFVCLSVSLSRSLCRLFIWDLDYVLHNTVCNVEQLRFEQKC